MFKAVSCVWGEIVLHIRPWSVEPEVNMKWLRCGEPESNSERPSSVDITTDMTTRAEMTMRLIALNLQNSELYLSLAEGQGMDKKGFADNLFKEKKEVGEGDASKDMRAE